MTSQALISKIIFHFSFISDEKSRVVLPKTSEEDEDDTSYINASYIEVWPPNNPMIQLCSYAFVLSFLPACVRSLTMSIEPNENPPKLQSLPASISIPFRKSRLVQSSPKPSNLGDGLKSQVSDLEEKNSYTTRNLSKCCWNPTTIDGNHSFSGTIKLQSGKNVIL